MTWQDILLIIGPLGALSSWIYYRIDKKFDRIEERFDNTDRRFDSVLGELKDMRKELQTLDSRISRIEGQLTPHYWEPKIKGEPK